MAGCSSASVWAELLPSVTHFPRQQESLPGRVKKQPLSQQQRQQPRRSLPLLPFLFLPLVPGVFSLYSAPPPYPAGFQQPRRVIPLLPSLSVAPRFAQLPPSTAASLNESLMRLWVVRTTAPSEARLISLRRGDGAQRYCSRQGRRRWTQARNGQEKGSRKEEGRHGTRETQTLTNGATTYTWIGRHAAEGTSKMGNREETLRLKAKVNFIVLANGFP